MVQPYSSGDTAKTNGSGNVGFAADESVEKVESGEKATAADRKVNLVVPRDKSVKTEFGSVELSSEQYGEDRENQRSDYVIKNANFSVPIRKGCKKIGIKYLVRDVDFTVHSGETCAIMGPSGAGKTSLLELLAFQGSAGLRTGVATLNAEEVTRDIFKQFCAYVPQHDSGWWCLTCRETITYTAQLMLMGNSEQKQARIELLLKDMGLVSCEDTRVGNEFIKGLSGGQRRRLSLAVALLGNPLVLFLDEVTSGLDAASAASIMGFLAHLTVKKQVAAIMTIHQPSGKVFKEITKLVLMTGGKVAYRGKTKDAVKYFGHLGRTMPAFENPADFLLELVNKDFADEESVEEIKGVWQMRKKHGRSCKSSRMLRDSDSLKAKAKQHVCSETWILLRRLTVVAIRDPTAYSGRMIIICQTCVFFSIIYFNSRDTIQEQVLSRHWLHAWHVGIATLMAMVFCFPAAMEFQAVLKEVKANNYRLGTYILAQSILQVPLLMTIAIVATLPSGFGLGAWSLDAFWEIELMMFCILWLYESLAQFLAVVSPHPAVATMGVTSFWLINFLFGGTVVRRDDIPWPFRVFAYICPYAYVSRSISYADFSRQEFSGAVRMPDGSFACPGKLPIECYGITGEEVLASLSRIVFQLKPYDTLMEDFAIAFGMASLFKLLFIITAYYKVAKQGKRIIPQDIDHGEEVAVQGPKTRPTNVGDLDRRTKKITMMAKKLDEIEQSERASIRASHLSGGGSSGRGSKGFASEGSKEFSGKGSKEFAGNTSEGYDSRTSKIRFVSGENGEPPIMEVEGEEIMCEI